ncbi:DUF11 domain-containing protein [Methanobacterium congolense]|uniref:Conserved repeat domain protein n=1 Tax=Methanobacterium congolense TaxID=118062 RepID=A0A1D3L0X5_9EURY|nr:DUF11 domain-containing protein [Methanobacterium congolense]SCG85218.1 Conserved repeat domain protein [Methanobacterium congolense]
MRKQIKPKAQVMFLLLTIFAIMVSVSSVSAAPLPTVSQVYVSVNGSDANSGTVDSPYLTIQKGVDSISENGTMYIANGVYNGTGNTNITISKNMNITGQSQAGTIINGTGTNWIFNINSGVTAIITNLTLTQGYKSGSGAICNYGTLTVINCTFTNNNATNYGGAIYSSGILTVENCSFISNNASAYGGAISAEFGTCIVNECIFIDNIINNYGGGGAIALGSTNGIVTGSTFIGNSAMTSNGGGALYSQQNLTANYNRFYKNIASKGNDIYLLGGLVSAENNWWGSNDPVWTNLIYRMSNPAQWLYMTINATPTTINNTQTSLVTVIFNNIYNGTTVTPINPANGHIPDGTLVTFSSALGSFDPATPTTFNGIATALFTANQTGTGNLTATTDNQKVTQLTVNPVSYLYLNVTSSKNNPSVGETFVLTYKLSNSGPDNATNVTMSFQIPAGLEFVNATVDNGTWTYNPANRTVTWTLRNVAVGDPYLYLTVRALGSGSYTIIPTITSDTYNRNTDPLTPFTVNVQEQNNSNGNTVNAASTTKTVAMKDTGLPLNYLVLAILAVISGFVMPRRK